MAQEHHVDERRQLPEEDLSRETQHNRRAVTVGYGDADADQRHHAGCAAAQFVGQPNEKGPTTIEIDGTGQRELNPNGARQPLRYPFQANPRLQRGGEQKDGKTQGQADPKPPAEVGDHVSMVLRVIVAPRCRRVARSWLGVSMMVRMSTMFVRGTVGRLGMVSVAVMSRVGVVVVSIHGRRRGGKERKRTE